MFNVKQVKLNVLTAVNPAYGYNYVTPEMGVAGAVLIFIGLFLLLAGVRAHRLTLGISGFLTIG